MPHRLPSWDYVNQLGNPTKSGIVNDLLKYVRKCEARKVGAASQAKRDMTMGEFRSLLEKLVEKEDFKHRFKYTTMIKYQFHLCARIDDTAHFKMQDLCSHSNPRFSSFAIQTKVRWSKNVLDERNCPDQIFLGSMDSDFCILLALGV
jgi:hypothetical protein